MLVIWCIVCTEAQVRTRIKIVDLDSHLFEAGSHHCLARPFRPCGALLAMGSIGLRRTGIAVYSVSLRDATETLFYFDLVV